MKESLGTRIKNAWNVFLNKDLLNTEYYNDIGASSYGGRPDRIRFSYGNERTMTSSIYTRIGVDAASSKIIHAKMDTNGRFKETIKSGLNYCLTAEANIDQTGTAFVQDVVMSLCDEGTVAIVPIDTERNPRNSIDYEIRTLRTGKILEWYPKHVKVDLYNDRTGNREQLILPKQQIGIIENPLYAVMNEPNSTLRRLIHKLSLLDMIDNQIGSGKLDLILQLPYVIKSASRQEEAESRRQAIEDQLFNSKYGVAYTDGTERITQLNRPVENNLLKQIESLTNMLYSQLGLSEEILSGKADEKQMLNYNNRTLKPIVSAITEELNRKFLSRKLRDEGHSIMAFNEPFKLVPLDNLAEIADKFTRNEILSSNEIRSIIGFTPSDDPGADELRNKNLNQAAQDPSDVIEKTIDKKNKGGNSQNGI